MSRTPPASSPCPNRIWSSPRRNCFAAFRPTRTGAPTPSTARRLPGPRARGTSGGTRTVRSSLASWPARRGPGVGNPGGGRGIFEGRIPRLTHHRATSQRQSGRSHGPRQRHHSRQRAAGGVGRKGADQGRDVDPPLASRRRLADATRRQPPPSINVVAPGSGIVK